MPLVGQLRRLGLEFSGAAAGRPDRRDKCPTLSCWQAPADQQPVSCQRASWPRQVFLGIAQAVTHARAAALFQWLSIK